MTETHRAETAGEVQTDMNRLVRAMAARVRAALPQESGIEMSDLIQAGNLGLAQAKLSFCSQKGSSLAGYAQFRIRGEMLDAVRRNTRSARAGITTQGSTADDGTTIEEIIPASPDASPLNLLTKNQRATILGEEVARLPERYRAVVRLRYDDDCSHREIGEALSIHETRAFQLHRHALGRLRRALSRRGVRCASMLM